MSVTPAESGATRASLDSRLSDPQVVNALTTLLDHADLLALLVEGLTSSCRGRR
ncbi:MAG: hypothetical protein R2731_12570 [Nocardioides sp.]